MKECSVSFKTRFLSKLETRLDEAFRDALAARVFSGAALLVSVGEGVTFAGNYGHLSWGGGPVTDATRFDLASLTKPLATVPLVMACVSRGTLALDDTLERFYPEVPEDKRKITIRQLLAHCSGLAPYRQYFFELVKIEPEKRKAALASMIMSEPLDFAPGSAAAYSDLGYMLLGFILEKILGSNLDELAREMVFSPLGIGELHFCPLDTGGGPEIPPARDPRFEALEYAAAELCPWRKRVLSGEVSDENAWSLGGVAGHAGLFGTVRSVFAVVDHLRSIYQGRAEEPLMPRDVVRFFWTRGETPADSTWALGFDTPRLAESSSGRYFSRRSVGHLGFTGTSFWLDLERDVAVVVLTNRVHPSRENETHRAFRPRVHDIVMEALIQ